MISNMMHLLLSLLALAILRAIRLNYILLIANDIEFFISHAFEFPLLKIMFIYRAFLIELMFS